MARFVSQTLVRTTKAGAACGKLNAVRLVAFRGHSTWADSSSSAEPTLAEADARMVEKIEDAIHRIIVKRSRPDWLPFIPGASYWVPPRRRSYGVAKIVDQLSNALTDEEYMSLTSSFGWPCSAYFRSTEVYAYPTAGKKDSGESSTPEEEK